MDLLEQADLLGKLIAESEEYKKMTEAQAAQLADSKAQEMLAAYNDLTNEFAMKVKAGEPTKEEMEHYKTTLTAEYQKLNANETIRNYIFTQQAFDALMKKVNSMIARHVAPQSDCSGDCGSCGGCH